MLKKLFFLAPLLLLFTSSYTSSSYTPILMDRAMLETSVAMAGMAKPITNPGKICIYKQWVLLVEKYKGIHLIDNTDPAKPVRRDFLRIPGCIDIAVGHGIIYADNAVDLVGVSVNFSTLKAHEVCRQKGILPEIVSPYGYIPSAFSRRNRPANTEIVGWKADEINVNTYE